MDRDKVISNLRAALLSSKGGVHIDEVNRDFKTIIGENIPFRKLGFQSLDAFLKSIPGIRLTNKGGQTYVEALPTEKSCHLTKLVSNQKTACKKKLQKGSYRNLTPFRMPHSTRKVVYPGKNVNANSSIHLRNSTTNNTSQKAKSIVPLMQVSTGYISASSLGRPRYMQPSSEVPNSPSKRLKDRKPDAIQTILNQSVNKPNNNVLFKSNDNGEKLATPVITSRPKTMQKYAEATNEKWPLNISERLKINTDIPSNSFKSNNVSTPPQHSEVLSPLSPAQLIGNNKQFSFINTVPLKAKEQKQKETVKSVPTSTQDPLSKLEVRARNLNLPDPVYRIVSKQSKNPKESAIYAHIKVGPHTYSNYPDDAHSDDEALRMAVERAMIDLTEKYGSLPNITKTTSKELIQKRIIAIVNTHMNGVFKHQIPVYYKQEHGECLPTGWFDVIEDCSDIILEKGADNSIILQRHEIGKEKRPESISPKSDKIQLNPIGPIVPGQLQLPEDPYWIVHVCCVISTVDVWVRLAGSDYSDKFDVMVAEMLEYYNRNQPSVKTVETGNYYAIFEDECWHRVRCEELDSNTGVATVLFIDHGDEGQRSCSDLRVLDKKFCSLPAQAMRMCLASLEDFSDCETVLVHIEKLLLGQTFYVEVLDHGVDKDGPYATVEFYDTSGPDDVNLNKVLYKKILHNIIALPQLNIAGQVTEAFVSHVEKNGDVYVQIQTEGMKYLVHLINRFTTSGLTADILKYSIVTAVDRTKKYFVSVDGNWYRGEITDIYSNDQVKIFLIDFGNTVLASKANLLHLEKLSDVLTKYPAQALKVHLHNIEKSMFNEKMVSRLIKLAPQSEPILVKVITHSSTGIPVVELFKRIQPDNVLASINTTLSYEEFKRTNGDGNNNIKTRKRVERTTSRVGVNEDDDSIKSLKPPKITGLGEFFDIHVTMAAHPGNFTVQPLDDKRSLEAMMIELQDVCLAYQGSYPSVDSIKEGKLYAAKHIDEHWYRVCVSNIINENMVTVYFCDFGDVSILSLDKLQPLRSQFLELPYQAIKARLVGIKPVNMDWSVEDCLRFQRLVLEKNFVSIVVESGHDVSNPADTILGLKLIDVETAEDIYIDQLLVEEGRAVYTD
ncbi:hypothetical protein KPH14_002552 [Odynerus spinipes]|uniref:Tudor domain-containing protein 7 n=1 Tax=Odynerus spinipes TaxID=1348599 RepID=A0AAD9RS59_9HYME|nr:hypothetical protein KPH14_002552 [Odynerus spinipes]